MADEDKDSKTQDPTQKRLDDAHEKGDVAKSQEVNTWFLIAASTLLLSSFSGSVGTAIEVPMRNRLMNAHQIRVDGPGVLSLVSRLEWMLITALGVPLLLLLIAAVGSNLIQHRPDGAGRIDAPARIGDGGASRHPVARAGKAPARHAIDIGEGQAVLPGVIGAQQIGQLGAIDIDIQKMPVAAAPGIGRIAQAALGRGTAGFPQRGDEAAEAVFILRGPMVAQDAPRLRRRRGKPQHRQDQGQDDHAHRAKLTGGPGQGGGELRRWLTARPSICRAAD